MPVDQTKETLDLEPLPMEASIVDVDLDAKLAGLGEKAEVSEASFRTAMDSLFSILAGSGSRIVRKGTLMVDGQHKKARNSSR